MATKYNVQSWFGFQTRKKKQQKEHFWEQLTKFEYGLHIRQYFCIIARCLDFNHCIVVM